MNEPPLHISVIICTQNRAESLRITLECLASANREGIRAEVVVVDNAGSDNTKDVVDSFRHLIPMRYLYEPTRGVFGKSHALNRALDAGGLGDIIAVLDDDMSVHPDWFQGVAAICKRWPNKDVFTGSTHVIWPCDDVPDWAKKASLLGGMFSCMNIGNSDIPLEDGQWFLGGHFWFRSRVLEGGRRFKDIWLTEPDFQLDLVEQGFCGVAGPDAIAGHRVQLELLQRDIALQRARKGGDRAWVRLQPYRKSVRQARLFQAHPWLARLYCVLNYLRWSLLYLASYLYPSDAGRFERRLIALERMTIALEYLRVANRLEDYSLWKKVRAEQS
jgi:glycosyltransferase involved in cell wall biosynthesis